MRPPTQKDTMYFAPMTAEVERQPDGLIFIDARLSTESRVEFVVDEQERVTFHGLSIGKDRNVGGIDPIGGTPLPDSELKDKLLEMARSLR